MTVATQAGYPAVLPAVTTEEVTDQAANQRYARTWGCLAGLAYGDARGKPFAFFRPAEILKVYGTNLDWPVPVPASPERRCWMRYETSDDTFQTLCVAHSLTTRHRLEPDDIAGRLASLPGRYASRQSAIEGLRERRRGRNTPLPSLGSGAAMRAAPIALAFFNSELPDFVAAVTAASWVSHSARGPIAGAASTAAFVRAMLRGADVEEGVQQAIKAAWLAARCGEDDRPPMDELIARAIDRSDDLESLLPTSMNDGKLVWNVVPIAFAVIWRHRKALTVPEAVRDAVTLGADADTQGAIVGYMAGSANPGSIPRDIMELIEDRNAFRLDEIATLLWQMSLRPQSPYAGESR